MDDKPVLSFSEAVPLPVAVIGALLLLCGGCRVECNVHHQSKATATEATR